MSGIRRRAIHKRLVEERNRATGSVDMMKGLLDVQSGLTVKALAERDTFKAALGALGVIGNSYCFCSDYRDPDKAEHQPECRDARIVLGVLPEAEREFTSEEIAVVGAGVEKLIEEGDRP